MRNNLLILAGILLGSFIFVLGGPRSGAQNLDEPEVEVSGECMQAFMSAWKSQQASKIPPADRDLKNYYIVLKSRTGKYEVDFVPRLNEKALPNGGWEFTKKARGYHYELSGSGTGFKVVRRYVTD